MAGGSTVLATNGVALPIDNLAKVFAYSGAFLSTITVVYNGITYVQTYTNNGAQLTSESQWVAL